jgi:hypothetical protein
LTLLSRSGSRSFRGSRSALAGATLALLEPIIAQQARHLLALTLDGMARLRSAPNWRAHASLNPGVEVFLGIDRDPPKQVEARPAAAGGKCGKRGFGAWNVVFFANVGRCFTTAVVPSVASHLLLK